MRCGIYLPKKMKNIWIEKINSYLCNPKTKIMGMIP